MKTFNLNNFILVQITEYGWEHLNKEELPDYITHCILPREQIIDGVKYYKLQAHTVIELFGKATWMTHRCPINVNILIPEE